ncbi:SNF-related serine/threonine-protein kinase-like [Ischnura elegans]|uniref:SNF-related serine/threonine-protein kinase-like n=1 Tax=Ischnura elegans TaxID=197161 RepID=UPI001ED86E20|nr:SNF-related serine/threonine-protein kinase-like [Ischnura elegans]
MHPRRGPMGLGASGNSGATAGRFGPAPPTGRQRQHHQSPGQQVGVMSPGSLVAGAYDGKIAGLYDLEETLGRGHFAVVKLARHVFTGEKVAVKVIDKAKLDDVSRAHLFQEVRCMKLVQHPNVVRLYEVIDTQTKLYLVLELADGGDLYDLIMRHDGGLPDHVAREHFRQIVRAISYCHKLHVVHRDLKPENVVFFEKLGVVKLTDFGFSNRFCPGQKLETSCGSLAYSAPEILLGDSYDAPAVDVWSLGVILYMLVCGTAPFQEANDSETLTMIMDCKFTVPNHVPLACKRLIQRMLIREPERRATLEEIASDPWLCEGGSGGSSDFLPLVSREHVSEEDHALIIQKMVNGKIAAKEEILEALDKNEYNHVTATYFLLAERKLRAHRQEQQRLGPKRAVAHATPRPVSAGYAPQGTPRPTPPRFTAPAPALIVPQSAKALGREGMRELMEESSIIEEKKEEKSALKVGQTLLSVPRTPLEVPQSYRARKCSIVQEEEDEDEISSPGRDDGSHSGGGGGSLNRRGSRSEGRLNVAVQERLATPPPPAPSLAEPVKRPLVRPRMLSPLAAAQGTTTVLTESSTVAIPPRAVVAAPPRLGYRSLPSPTRPLHAVCSSPQLTLNEIFEEGSEPAAQGHRPPPPPVQRSYHHSRTSTKLGSSSSGGVATEDPGGENRGFERRQKMHKARTASCSSSDASDEDSESRKKRAHKLKSLPKRDSHDDSSDSQDPGGGGGGGGRGGGGNGGGGGGGGGRGGQPPPQSSSRGGSAHSFRRRSAGGGAGETRLRESQSLNRITEVQEGSVTPPPMPRVLTEQGRSHAEVPRARSGVKLFGGWRRSQGTGVAVNVKEPVALQAGECAAVDGSDKAMVPSMQDRAVAGDGMVTAKKVSAQDEEGGKENRRVRSACMEYGGKARLARYFRLHRKLWLPGLLRGRLYKAQSCGSIRDRVRSAPSQANIVGNTEKQCRVLGGGVLAKAKKSSSSLDALPDINRNVNGNVNSKGKSAVVRGHAIALPCACHGLDASECCSLC